MAYTYQTLTQALSRAGIDQPAYEASLLLEHFAGVSYATLMTDRDRVYDLPALESAVTRRLSREPLQYILGEWDFYGCTFRVTPDCLIPRPDTEILAETAIKALPRGARVADLCTGSGCIAVATLYHRLDVTADALELSPQNLALATENANRNGVTDRFNPIEADLLGDGSAKLSPRAPYDAILSNPPYIPTADIAALSPEVHREPIAALDGGEDGLVFYRAILRDYAQLVKPGGLILLEMAYDQAEDLKALAAQYLPEASLEILRDLGGNDRVTKITLPTH
ncbi:MAG: peptide chain release factor N(5)-glutamine methyltransferase [Clostridia bacterium]|nr:peptide chain release factor N(5)-glutamine methyltransferase [Clostridia bacterium]